MASLIPFIGVSLLVIVTPGQDTLLTVRNTLIGGRIAGWLTALGVVTGQLAWTLAATFGLSAALVAYPSAFVAIQLAGAGYLVIIGAQSLRAAIQRSRIASPGSELRPAIRRGPSLRQGLFSNLGNPKTLLFFTSLLPQFSDGRSASDLLALGLTFCVLTLLWLCLYAVAVARLGNLFARTTLSRTLEGLAGVSLVALGLRIATDAAA